MLTPGAALNGKLQSKYASATNSEGETSLSAKKKPFQRKPASSQLSNTSEKKRRLAQEQLHSAILDINQFEVEPYPLNTDGPIKINFVKRKERQTECYNKQKEASFEGLYKPKKDTSYSPITSKKNIFDGVSYFSKNPSTKMMESFSNFTSLDQSYASTPSNSRVVYEQYKNNAETNAFPIYLNPRKKAQPSFTQNVTPVLTPTASYAKLTRTNAALAKNPPKVERGKESSPMVECTYCKNNKEMTDIMCEKYRKLQEQLTAKNQKIKELTGKLETLKEDHSKLNEKYESKLQSSQIREIQYFREREELLGRIDGSKSDLCRLSQRLKYADMENAMLLRYKDEIQLMEKEYDLVMAENDRLQRTISALKRGPEGGKFKKSKEDGERKAPSVPYLQGFSHKHSEDDLASLSLSERSFDQF